ncbi:hypothetical protein CQ12_28760 [Bradyrhizobium jicamae]|uniref:Uncharacterized protein n=1 Tax=Bradyrhizobium jicamae TaxID=280332 RepID=A0A0R3M465_9BRAD|nr:hypothetical protein CQ12_28760 [Bradyrhizobium jicamae]
MRRQAGDAGFCIRLQNFPGTFFLQNHPKVSTTITEKAAGGRAMGTAPFASDDAELQMPLERDIRR